MRFANALKVCDFEASVPGLRVGEIRLMGRSAALEFRRGTDTRLCESC